MNVKVLSNLVFHIHNIHHASHILLPPSFTTFTDYRHITLNILCCIWLLLIIIQYPSICIMCYYLSEVYIFFFNLGPNFKTQILKAHIYNLVYVQVVCILFLTRRSDRDLYKWLWNLRHKTMPRRNVLWVKIRL